MSPTTTAQRFWAKVERGTGCWLWRGSKRHKGYGAFVYAKDGKGINGRAHRYMFEMMHGDIPPGMWVLHTCDVPACVNPLHLFLGTLQDNVDDMMRKGRHVAGGTYTRGAYSRGEQHPGAKLTQDIVQQIRKDREAGMSLGSLPRRYGLGPAHVHSIVMRRLWRHVP